MKVCEQCGLKKDVRDYYGTLLCGSCYTDYNVISDNEFEDDYLGMI